MIRIITGIVKNTDILSAGMVANQREFVGITDVLPVYYRWIRLCKEIRQLVAPQLPHVLIEYAAQYIQDRDGELAAG